MPAGNTTIGTERQSSRPEVGMSSSPLSFRDIGRVIVDKLKDPKTYIPSIVLYIRDIAQGSAQKRRDRRWVEMQRAILQESIAYGCFLPDSDLGFGYADAAAAAAPEALQEKPCGTCGGPCAYGPEFATN